MGPKTKKNLRPDHRKGLQKAGHRSNSDVDDSIKATDQSSYVETFLANSSDKLRDQKQFLDMTHALSEADLTLSCMQSDLNGSASKTNTDESSATNCQNLELVGKVSRIEEDELYSDASIEAAGVSGSFCASEKLMQQIDSLLRDSEIIAPHKPEFRFEECELKHLDDDVSEHNFKLETGTETLELSATYAGNVSENDITVPCDSARNKVCEGQDAEKLSEVRPLNNLAKAEFFLADNECLAEFLNLLHRLNVICCKSEFQQHLCLSMVHQNDEDLQIDQDEVEFDGERGEKCDTLSVLTKVDDSENSIQAKEDKIKKLLLSISKVLEKSQFSSAVELNKFLVVIEQMKVEIDQWCHIQNKMKTASSRDNEDETALDSACGGVESVNDALSVLRTKPRQILTRLSNSLVIYQDFIETRAELEHELTLEQDLLNLIHTNINYNESLRTKLEVEHDLKLVEDKLDDYSQKIISLRRHNLQLAEILERSAISSNRSQTLILAGKLQNTRDSCLSLRSLLDAAPDESLSSSQVTSEPKNSFHLSNAQMEKSAEDFDKLNIAHFVLKMILLLVLIILLLFFEPHLYHPLNRFRLPVPIHVRHVGTHPPM